MRIKNKAFAAARRVFAWLMQHNRTVAVPFVLIIYAYLGYQMARDWPQLKQTIQRLDAVALALSIALLFAAMGVVAGRWFFSLRALGVSIGWWKSLHIWFLSQAGRYIPGSIWPYVARFYWGGDAIPPQAMVGSMALEIILRISSELSVAAVALLLWPRSAPLPATWGTALGAAAVAVIVAQALAIPCAPWLWRKSRPWLVRLVPRLASLNELHNVGYRRMAALWAYYVASVLIVGVAFYLFVTALFPVSYTLLFAITGSLAAATVIGFLTPIAPNGWGVREGVLVLLLAQFMPEALAVIISVTSRIWLALPEALWVLALMLLSRGWRHRDADAAST